MRSWPDPKLIAKAGGFDSLFDEPLLANVQFVLEDQFQELLVGQLVSLGVLQAPGWLPLFPGTLRTSA